MIDGGFFLFAAAVVTTLTALLAASKRWNPSHEGWLLFEVPWRYLRAAILVLGAGFIVGGLSGLFVGSDLAVPFLGAGILLVSAVYAVRVLMGDDDDL